MRNVAAVAMALGVALSVPLNFFPAARMAFGDPRKEGRQFVRVALAVSNPGKKPFAFNYTSVRLQTSDGTRNETTSSINEGNSKDRLEADGVPPQQIVKGALYFEVGAKETAETLTIVYAGHKGSVNKDSFIPLTPAP